MYPLIRTLFILAPCEERLTRIRSFSREQMESLPSTALAKRPYIWVRRAAFAESDWSASVLLAAASAAWICASESFRCCSTRARES